MINVTPDPIAVQIGPIPVYWYGVAYALGLVVAYLVMAREAERKGQSVDVLSTGIILVAVAALVGGRLYHVIDQWQLYRSDPLKIILPPYTGLGVYGGLITGTLAAVAYARYRRVPFWTWADIVAPGLFAMQMIGRWGNFANQELYGPPTNLPWGLAIECDKRIADFPCATYPFATTGFQPLFLYESLSGLVGLLALLWIGRRLAGRLRPGDLLALFFVWYGIVRFGLETLRHDNWLFFGIPTAQLFSLGFVVAGLAMAYWHHVVRPGPSAAESDAAWRAAQEGSDDEDEYDDEDAWEADLAERGSAPNPDTGHA
ncbi:MAG TPA: prolipoprotein diacylglyceryl transferase [Candidatus Limnocylindrales bacterium]|nr:prolipoprotein diacylglyceryl transferase [Candidatus Limnocylindrales bacterium]